MPQCRRKDLFRNGGGDEGEGGRNRVRQRETLINKLRILHVCIIQPFLSVILTQVEQLVARKRGECVLMFLQNGGNKLDRDLANQNSLQKLSDPGGSRALDKQD